MTARVLVVDDIPSNVMLLKAQLAAQYFEVLTAADGYEALRLVEEQMPDVVLLDVMMPGMNGYEVCRRIRRMPDAASLPVVMVTALDRPDDRLAGLEAGADDFLTKPVNEAILLSRVKSLVRLKTLTDELQLRQTTARNMGVPDPVRCLVDAEPSGRILAVDDKESTLGVLRETLGAGHGLETTAEMETALARIAAENLDLVMVSLSMHAFDGLRLCARIRALPKGRNLPILVIAGRDEPLLTRAFELGVNDCIMRPVDANELRARVKWLLRKKRYADELMDSLARSLDLATTDALTGLHNRHFINHHLALLVEKANASGQELTLMMFDIDHFKNINDAHGHDIGDEVLRAFAGRLGQVVRSSDLVCRYGGEEFVVLMRNTDGAHAQMIAERVRALLEAKPVAISRAPHEISVTVSVGVAATASGKSDTAAAIFHRADQALYRAKRTGRNRVCRDAIDA